MPPKQVAPAGGASLTIAQYSTAVLQRYLRREFDPTSPQRNLAAAAGQLYELLAKVRGAAGKDSEDAKAPLKAIRNAIDQAAFHTAQGADSPEVDALLQLYSQLEVLCQQRMAAGGVEREAAGVVQDALRYRMTRLVTGDAWDGRPQLKLKILNLMFRFMVSENERLLASSRAGAAPAGSPARTPRQASFGRKGQAVQARAAHSRWGEAINELGRMQGSRLLPLLKLSLHENLTLSRAAEEAEAAAAAAEREAAAAATAASAAAQREAAAQPPAPASEAGSIKSTAGTAPTPASAAPLSPATPAAADGGLREPPQQALPPQQGGFSLDDLLGLSWEPSQEPPSRASPPEPSPSPPASGAATSAEQLFAAFDTIGTATAPGASSPAISSSNPFAEAGPGSRGPAPVGAGPYAAAGSQVAGFFPGSPPQGWAAPPSPSPELVRGQLSGMVLAGGPGPQPGSPLKSSNPYASTSAVGFDTFPDPAAFPELGPTAPPNLSGSVPSMSGMARLAEGSASGMELLRHNSNPALMPGSPPAAAPATDTSSPFFGRTNPFEPPFGDLAPRQLAAHRAPPPPPPGPPMRSLSGQ